MLSFYGILFAVGLVASVWSIADSIRRAASRTGFHPADQAAARLGASRFNPSRGEI